MRFGHFPFRNAPLLYWGVGPLADSHPGRVRGHDSSGVAELWLPSWHFLPSSFPGRWFEFFPRYARTHPEWLWLLFKFGLAFAPPFHHAYNYLPLIQVFYPLFNAFVPSLFSLSGVLVPPFATFFPLSDFTPALISVFAGGFRRIPHWALSLSPRTRPPLP